MKALIKNLCCSSYVSGYENQNQNDVMLDYLKNHNVPYEQDVIGNIIFQKKGPGEKTLMLVAHYDEIGLSVKYIDDNGYIYFSTIGGVDTSILRGQKVVIAHNGHFINGVIGAKPIHMINNTKNSNDKSIDVSDLWIDVGAIDKEDVRGLVSVGDPISFSPNYAELNDVFFTSKSIDNRVGVASLFTLYEKLKDVSINYKSIYFVLSCQEELGLRGAKIAGFNINPDMCIAIDVTHATDYPSINKNKYGDIRLNRGAVIPFGSNFTFALQRSLRDIANKYGYPYQTESLPGHSGTDIAEIQLLRGGCSSGLISIPCRYMHTPIETATFNDMKSVVDILFEFCCNNE
ncbi:MAG: hypothetical protein K5920_06605 [Bacteroidales bacterium]|nr:hypothetical protein [Bacteroidales bacterium]